MLENGVGHSVPTRMLPSDVPFIGASGESDDAYPQVFACDGREFASVEHLDGTPVIFADDDGNPQEDSLKDAKRYARVLKLAQDVLGVRK